MENAADSAWRNMLLSNPLAGDGISLMPHTTTIRGLERGIRVLQALQARPDSRLHDLFALTKIPKPSLLRILLTLERTGMITRRLADGRYRVGTVTARIGHQPDRYDRVAEAAAPVLDRLCARVSWPSEFLVPAGDHMEVRESSRPRSPFAIATYGIGHKVDWLMSAVGRAYLAYCPAAERQRILRMLRRSRRLGHHLAHDPKRIDAILAETRDRGFGIRDPGFTGGMFGGPVISDGLAAIAVPLLSGKAIHGVINMNWLQPAFTIEEFARLHLGDLRAAAEEIASSLRERR
jgi:IclR family mhp operon transcriptional activator